MTNETPEHLSTKSKKMFEYYSGKAAVTPGQIALLVTALECLDEADSCTEAIAKQGLTVTSERSGITRQNPLIGTRREAQQTVIKIFKLLGLDKDTYRTPGLAGFEVDYETTTEEG